MRLTSEFFVSALIRRVFRDGGFAAVDRRGADAAGAVLIRCRHRDGTETLYGPAPQSLIAETADDRRFEIRIERGEADAIADVIARETKWDPDLWLVEIETDAPGDYVEVAG